MISFQRKPHTCYNQESLSIVIRESNLCLWLLDYFAAWKRRIELKAKGIKKKKKVLCVHVAFWAISLIPMDTSFLCVALWVRCEDHVCTGGKWCDSMWSRKSLRSESEAIVSLIFQWFFTLFPGRKLGAKTSDQHMSTTFCVEFPL